MFKKMHSWVLSFFYGRKTPHVCVPPSSQLGTVDTSDINPKYLTTLDFAASYIMNRDGHYFFWKKILQLLKNTGVDLSESKYRVEISLVEDPFLDNIHFSILWQPRGGDHNLLLPRAEEILKETEKELDEIAVEQNKCPHCLQRLSEKN